MGNVNSTRSLKAEKELPEKIVRTGKKGVLILFSLFFIIGSIIFFFLGLRPLVKIILARDWNETPCKIISSQVGSHRGSKGGRTYSIDIIYSYEVNGRTYNSEDYYFLNFSSSGYSSKKAVVRKYPTGKTAVCYVNPNDPEEAVLNRGFEWVLLIGLIPLVFVLIGLIGFIVTLTRSGKKTHIYQSGRGALPSDDYVDYSSKDFYEEGSEGKGRKLKQASSAVKNFLGILFFTLFWNGICSVFIYQAVKGFMKGRPDWFLTIFLIPFVLIGLGTLLGALYCFLAIFNPKPVFTIADRIHIGDQFKISWNFPHRSGRISKLTIHLEGREEVIFQQGKSTRTSKNVFFKQEIIDSNESSEIKNGEKEISIPCEACMHSFDGTYNKILWRLVVKGDIKFWPDINSEYQLVVLPVKKESKRS